MKKTITFFALLMFGLLLVHAQNSLTRSNIDVGSAKQFEESTQTFLDVSPGIHVVYSSGMAEKPAKGTRGDVVITFNDNDDVKSKGILSCPEEFEYWDSYTDGENLISLYTVYDKKAKKFAIYTNTIEVNESTPGWNPLELTSFSCERKDYVYKILCCSPNKSKSALILCQVDKQSELKGAAVFVMGEVGERLWQNDFEFNFSQRTLSIIDAVISDEGNVYVGVTSRSGKTDATLHVYEIRESQTYNYSEPTDFGFISNGKMLINKASNIMIAGYYQGNADGKELGCYSAIFDMNALNLASIGHQTFPSSYKEKVASKFVQNSIANQNCNVRTRGLYEFSNGNCALIGEVLGMLVVLENNGLKSYVYQAKSIMFTSVTANGELSEPEMLAKDQITSRYSNAFTFEQLGLSFKTIQANDKLYLIFNDNLENYNGKSGVQCKCVPGKMGAGMYTIDANGEVNKQLLLDMKAAKLNSIVPFYGDENTITIETIDKKVVSIAKINL